MIMTKRQIGYTIPHERVTDGDLNSFIAEVWRLHLAHKKAEQIDGR